MVIQLVYHMLIQVGSGLDRSLVVGDKISHIRPGGGLSHHVAFIKKN